MPTLVGTDGDDTITGTGDDVIDGRAGNDVIRVGPGRSIVSAGDGDDRVIVSMIAPNTGGLTVADTIDGGAGTDTIDASLVPDGFVRWVVEGGAINLNRMVSFRNFPATLAGTTTTTGFERFIGSNLGNEFIFTGLTRSVEIVGGASFNTIIGGSAADIIRGGASVDTITLGAGDTIFGNGGDDSFRITSSDYTLVPTAVDGGEGADTLVLDLQNGAAITITSDNSVLRWGGISLTSVENVTFNFARSDVVATVNLTGGAEANRFVLSGAGFANTGLIEISGGGGDDYLDVNSRNSILRGGDGNDAIIGQGLLYGDDGDDSLRSYGQGSLYGGRGNDVLDSGVLMDGGEGDDVFIVTSNTTTVVGGAGADTLSFVNVYAPNGGNFIQFDLRSGVVTYSTGSSATATGIERVIGSYYDDLFIGDDVSNILRGEAGNDRLSGGGGDDTLSGGFGADVLEGGDGADILLGDDGGDILSGGAGNDWLDGGNGTDVLNGGAGDDQLAGGTGNDTIDGGAGDDTAIFGVARSGALISNQNGQITVVSTEGIDTLTGIEHVRFSDGLYDLRADGQLAGQARRTLTGTNASEILNGGESNDVLDGGGGSDTLFGGLGNDILTGGSGTDTAVFGHARSAATITYENGAIVVTGAEGRDVLNGIEWLQFSEGAFEVVNGVLSAQPRAGLVGTANADVIASRTGGETIDGGAGFDAVTYTGVVRQYAVRGGATSTITGGAEGGVDTLVSIEEARFIDGAMSFDINGIPAQVMRLYDTALDRLPDQAGLEVQIRAIASGATTLQGLADAFIASPEFVARYGNLSNQTFVEQLYRFALDREGDAPGIAAQVNALNTGTSRAQLLIAFSESSEHRGLTQPTLSAGLWIPDAEALQIARLYDATFDRLPDAPGLASQIAALDGGTSLISIAANFAASAEFQARYGALSNQQFVEQLYRFCLNREGDASGIAVQVNALNSGTSRAQILLNFSESAEHIALTAPSWSGGVRTLDTVADRLASPIEDHGEASDAQVSPLAEDGHVKNHAHDAALFVIWTAPDHTLIDPHLDWLVA